MSDLQIIGSTRDDFQGDFLGFTFNGRHSSEFGLVRTSSSNRYDRNILPTMKDKTVEVPGGDGTYYFGSSYTSRPFSISVAFDSMSQEQFDELAVWLGDGKIHELSFDESDYKAYDVKCTGTPNLKFLCFETDQGDVYKGEGTIQFTAYYPFAHSRILNNSAINELSSYINDIKVLYNLQSNQEIRQFINNHIIFRINTNANIPNNTLFLENTELGIKLEYYDITANSKTLMNIDEKVKKIQYVTVGQILKCTLINETTSSIRLVGNYIFILSRKDFQQLINVNNNLSILSYPYGNNPSDWEVSIPINLIIPNNSININFQQSTDGVNFTNVNNCSLSITPISAEYSIIINSKTQLITQNEVISNNIITSGNFFKIPVLEIGKFYRFIIDRNGANIINNCAFNFRFLYY